MPHPFRWLGRNVLRVTSYVNDAYQHPQGFTSYWETTTPIDDLSTLQLITDDIHTLIGNVWKPLASADSSLEQTFVQYVDNVHTWDTLSGAASVAGTIARVGAGALADVLPATVALILQRRTGLPGRQHRGRMYVPGICETLSIDGVIAPSFRVPCIAFGAFFATDQVVGPGYTLNGRHWNRKDDALEVVVQGRVRVVLGTQKKRGFHGPFAVFV